MRHQITSVAVLAVALAFGVSSHAHPATEQYIPIGKSPGVSGKYTMMGVVQSVDRASNTVTVSGSKGAKSYRVDEKTRIYVDRNRWKLTNLKGSYRDCEAGVTVEIMYRHGDDSVAEWIKIEAQDAK